MTAAANDLILRALRREPVERAPVWLMRQAGRTDPAYREFRERDGRPLERLFCDPEAAVKVSLMPERLGVDAIIMFQDILTPLAPMGAEFLFRPGPRLERPVRTQDDVRALRAIDPARDLAFVGRTLRGLRAELSGRLPVLGFAGSPLTLAFFLVAGGSPGADPAPMFDWLEREAAAAAALMDLLTEMTADYLAYQLAEGAQAVQLFESWADVLPRGLYERWALPAHRKIFSALPAGALKILFAKECPFVDLMAESGADALSVGACVDLAAATRDYGGRFALQGNVDNRVLLTGGPEDVAAAVRACLAQGGVGHILNLNHGLLAASPFENVRAFVRAAKGLA